MRGNGSADFLQKQTRYEVHLGDAFAWMEARDPDSIHAIVTDPPYGLKEYTEREKTKLRAGRGGVWRILPSFDGCLRAPLPRFTILGDAEKRALQEFFREFARKALRILVPGGHIFIATNPLLSHLVYLALVEAGFEKRGEVIRLVQTLRGGDRPKNAHEAFPDVTVMPRSCWEPGDCFANRARGEFKITCVNGKRGVSGESRPWNHSGMRSAPRQPGRKKEPLRHIRR